MSELRAFAEVTYARPDVAAIALQLQDGWGADINLLLAAAWLAQRGEWLAPPVAMALVVDCRALREQLIVPQRAVRRALKRELPSLYPQALALEVALEFAQLDRIEAWLARQPAAPAPVPGPELLTDNLRAAFAAAAPLPAAEPTELLARLRQALVIVAES